MSCNNVQILNFNHNIVEVGSDNKLIITDNVKCNSITIPQPVTNILQINSPGPQGPAGASVNTGSFVTTSSFNAYTGSSTSQFAGTSSFAITASHALNGGGSTLSGGTDGYIPLWSGSSALTSSYLNQSNGILKSTYTGIDKGLKLDFSANSYTLGDPAGNTITVSDNGGGDNATLSLLNGIVTFNADDEININAIGAVVLNAAATYIKQLTSSPQLNILTIDTASGQLYYTASSAFGGGGGGASPGGSTGQIQYNNAGVFGGVDKLIFDGTNLRATGSFTGSFTGSLFGTATTASYVLQAVSASFATLAQTANTASYVVTAQTASYVLQAVSASYAATSSNILGGKATHVPFFITDTTLATSSIYQSGSSTVIINQDNATTANPEALYVYQPSQTSFNVISGKGNLNNYLQLNIQNTNQGTSASSDVVATADNGNETTNYIDMGINSENYSQNFVGAANDAYLYSTGRHLHIGNTSNFPVQIFAGGSDVDIHNKLELNPNNQHLMSGSLDVSGSIKAFSFTGSLQGNATSATTSNTSSYSTTLGASLSQPANNQVRLLNSAGGTLSTATINNVTSASYADNAATANFATTAGNGGVTNIVAGSGITLIPTSGVGSVTVISSGGGGVTIISGSNVTQSFSNTSTWTFNHNLGTRVPIITVFDTNYKQIIPQDIELVSTSSATITFPTAESGFAVASLGGATGTVLSSSYALFSTYADTASYYAETDPVYIAQKPTLATTGSNIFRGNQTITGSLTVSTTSDIPLQIKGGTGTLLSISSSTSEIFKISDTFSPNLFTVSTGSINVFNIDNTNKVVISGSLVVTGSITGSLAGTSSYADNANLLDGKDSTIFATTGSNNFNGNQTITGSLIVSGSGTFTNIGPAVFTGSVNITGSTTQTGNNTLIGNTVLSGSISISGSQTFNGTSISIGTQIVTGSLITSGSNTLVGNTVLSGSINISGSSTIQGTTIMSGSLNISGSTTQRGNNTLIGTTTLTGSINMSGDIIPTASSSFDLGSETNPWRSLYVQSGSISIQSDIPGGISAVISNANGNVTIAGAGLQLKSGSFVPFEISSTARTIIRVPNLPANDVGGLSIIGSSDGSYQGVTNAGGLLHLTSNDGASSRITSDAFGTAAVVVYAGRKARGTAASPLPVQSGDTLTRISTVGWTGPEYGFTMSASAVLAVTAIETVALENFTTSSFGTRYNFYNAPLGGTIRTLSAQIDTTGITIPSTSRFFGTASWASNAQTASYVLNTVTASYVLNAVSSSFASTASYVNPLRQDVIITGSLKVSGSLTEIGDTVLTGSLTLSSGSRLNINDGFYVNGNKQFNYGQFSSTETQSGSANTAYSATFNTTDFSQGVSLVAGSRITVANTGIYNIQFSSQLHTTANQAVDFSIWFAMTGSNIANSNTDFTIEKINGGGYVVAALNFLTQIASGSYIELKYSKTTAQGQLQAKGTQSTPTRPATPSVILTVTQIA